MGDVQGEAYPPDEMRQRHHPYHIVQPNDFPRAHCLRIELDAMGECL